MTDLFAAFTTSSVRAVLRLDPCVSIHAPKPWLARSSGGRLQQAPRFMEGPSPQAPSPGLHEPDRCCVACPPLSGGGCHPGRRLTQAQAYRSLSMLMEDGSNTEQGVGPAPYQHQGTCSLRERSFGNSGSRLP